MAITIRTTKGTALTHNEMDTNLTSYYVSSSVSRNTINLFTHGTGSFSAITHSLTVDTGSQAVYETGEGGVTISNYTASLTDYSNFTNNRVLKWNDSAEKLADTIISDNGSTVTVSGALTVTGIITGQEFHTEITSASIVYSSGSTKFGDSSDDTHEFTGSVHILNALYDSNDNAGTLGQILSSTATGIDWIDQQDTGSFLTTGSFNNSTRDLTLTKADGTTFDINIPDADSQNTYTAGDGLNLNSGEFSLDTGSAHFISGSWSTLTAGTAISITDGTITNTSPDQTVAFTGQNITINGTYPNFQLTGSTAGSDTTYTVSAETVTGGANLRLSGSDASTDDVAFKGSGATTVTRTDANTITISSTDTNTTYSTFTDNADGLVPNPGETGTTKFLRQDGTWVVPTDTDTNTFRTVTAGGNTLGATETLAFTEGTGISITESGGAVTITCDVTDTNTFRTVTAGGNTLGATETLAFTAGSNISISESGGAVTIAATDTNTFRTVTAGGNTLGSTETLAFTEGTGISITEDGGAVTITCDVVDTNTTYSAGNGLGLTGTTFSLDTPGTLTAATSNGVTTNSHTHAITTTTNGTASTIVATDSSSEITAANFVTTSDRRLKSEIEPIKDGLAVIKEIASYEYNKNGVKEAGFIAQEVQEVLPYAVREGEDGYLKMTDRAIIAHLNKAVQQLEERLSAIESKLG